MTRACATPGCGTRLRSTKTEAEVYCDPCEAREREAARLAGIEQGRRDPAKRLAVRIPEILAERGPCYSRQIADLTGSQESSVRRVLFDLIGSGVVERAGVHVGTMRYRLTVAKQLEGAA